MPLDYIDNIAYFFKKYAKSEEREKMSKYLKGKFVFWGVSASGRREIQKLLLDNFPMPSYEDAKVLAKELMSLPEREYNYLAIELLAKYKKMWQPTDIVFFEKIVLTKPWWDIIDIINSKIISNFFLKYPNIAESITREWCYSDSIWLKQLSIIYQLHYRSKTNLDILEKNILENVDNDNNFIQKAIGLALKEYSKTDYRWVLDFILNNSAKLKTISKHEAIKWIESKSLV